MNESKNNKQIENFQLGTVCIFAGIIFLTAFPAVLKNLFFLINPDAFKFFGTLFLFAGGVFYYFSSDFHLKQVFIIGICLIMFSFFQFFFSPSNRLMFDITGYIALLAGIFLIIKK
jgi:hypothetical protein